MEGGAKHDERLDALAALVARHAGLHLGERQRWLLDARVDARRAERAETRERYVARVLAGDEEELRALVETLRVGETRFFRHPRQLRALRRIAFPELVGACEAEGRALRAWSAGCATGEEAYTLALLLTHHDPGLSFGVWATDLSAAAIAHAERGLYDLERVRDVPEEWLAADFDAEGTRFRVRDRSRVRFEVHNLLDGPYPRELDLVLCRNVLIYFDAPTRARVLGQLFGAVRVGGYVALGYADHAGDVSGAEAIRTDDGVLYRRTEGVVRVGAAPGSEGQSASRGEVPAAPLRRAKATTPPARVAPASPSTPRVAPDAPRAPAPRETRHALEGELEGELGLRRAREVLEALLREGGGVLDLSGLRYADDEVGRELSRAAHALGAALRVVAPPGGIERFLRRHAVVPPATLGRPT